MAKNRHILLMVGLAVAIGSLIHTQFGNRIDYWLHDSALLFQARTNWQHTAIVVLDEAIPVQVTRLQAIPLFAKATERLVEAGVKG